jgi:hypothetical protein
VTRRCKQCKLVELKPARQCVDIVEKKGFCSIECLTAMARRKNIASSEKKARIKAQQDRERIKTLSAICSEVQRDVNAMIRAADEYLGHRCIATGEPIADCGHFFHAGSQYRISWLRFHHANLHGQGAKSNRYAGGGDALNYLNGLRERYGQTYIDELEDFKRCQDQGLWPKPTREELRAVAAWCRAMTRIYKRML